MAEELGPVTDRLSTALDSNTNHLVEKSSLYDEQAGQHIAKLSSTLQIPMEEQTFDPKDSIWIIGFLHAF